MTVKKMLYDKIVDSWNFFKPFVEEFEARKDDQQYWDDMIIHCGEYVHSEADKRLMQAFISFMDDLREREGKN